MEMSFTINLSVTIWVVGEIWRARQTFRLISTGPCSTLIYLLCPIHMRMGMDPKIGLCLIPLQMECVKFGWRSDPFWVCKWPVGSEVQSHLRTFVAVDQSFPTLESVQMPTPLLELCLGLELMRLVSIQTQQSPSLH